MTVVHFFSSKFRLLLNRRVKSSIFSFIDKKTYFEGRNKIGNGTFDSSYFGYGSYSGSSLPNTKVGRYTSIGSNCHIVSADHNMVQPSMSPVFNKSTLLKTENGYYAEIGNDVWIGNNVLIRGGNYWRWCNCWNGRRGDEGRCALYCSSRSTRKTD